MLERFDPSDLLAFVEGTLPAPKAAALERLLRDDPPNLDLLRRMRSDRARLQALPDPMPPASLLAELESRLARPMLMADSAIAWRIPGGADGRSPGRYGRRHRRRSRGRRLLRSVLATAALLMVAAGGWWAFQQWPGLPIDHEPNVHRDLAWSADAAMPPPVDSGSRPIAAPPNHLTTIVHAIPPLPARPAVPSLLAARPSNSELPLASGAVTAPLILVVQADADDLLEQLLLRVIHGFDPAKLPAALVRNISDSDLQTARLLEADEALGRSSSPVMTGSDTSGSSPPYGTEDDDDGRRLLGAIRSLRTGSGAADEPAGAHLAGPAEWAPTLDEQLALAARGATHVISVRLDHLPLLIQRLNDLARDDQAAAHLLPEGSEIDLRRSVSRRSVHWITEHARVREILDDLRTTATADSEAGPVVRIAVIRR